MAGILCSTFIGNGRLFVYYGADGKLKVWNTESGDLSQEYTPNLHLNLPCTCLTWVADDSPCSKKKKRLESHENDINAGVLAMGTTSGKVLLYSIARGSVVAELEGGHDYAVNHVAWRSGCNFFSCDAQNIVEWNFRKKMVKSKWKVRSGQLTCLLVLPGDKLVAAGTTIGVWDVPKQTLLREYIGHSSEVTSLTFVPGGDMYFISAAKNDRLLCAWSLSSTSQDKNSVASFVMEDVATSVTVMSHSCEVVAVTRTGILHLYRHQLNGKCMKPIKPALSVQIASDSGESKETVQPLSIQGACEIGTDLLIAWGSSFFLSFETIPAKSKENFMVLTRKDPQRFRTSKQYEPKVKQPETDGNVQYISPAGTFGMLSTRVNKRKSNEAVEKTCDLNLTTMPMERRVDNLSLSSHPQHGPKANSMVQLLMQGLNSGDKEILQTVLRKDDPSLISNTVLRLPVQCIVHLTKQLVEQFQQTAYVSRRATLWLKAVLRAHAGHLLTNPDMLNLLSPILGLTETRLNLLPQMSRLRGRLDLLMDQMEDMKTENKQDLGECLLVYQDQDSDEGSELGDAASGSESEDHWEELSEMEVEDNGDETENEVENDASMSN